MAAGFDRSSPALPELLAAQTALTARIQRLADGTSLVLFLLSAGVLLFRPADLFPALEGVPIYEMMISACLVVSLPRILSQLRSGSLLRNGIVALSLTLVPAVLLSHLSHAHLYEARVGGLEMAKACTLFLLVVMVVDSPGKLTATLLAIMTAVFAVTVLAILQYHGVLNLPGLQSVTDRSHDLDTPALIRLCGVGVFNDPNDFSLVLVTAAVICVHGLGQRPLPLVRLALLVPLALFGYALMLTHSRGGLFSALSAVVAFLAARLGWRNALPLACLVIPGFLVVFWGRQTSVHLGDPDDTFQARLGLWSDSLEAFRSAPIMGIGQGRLTDAIGQVTHNSFLHAFAEMGLLGGIVFIGAFYLVLRGLWHASPVDRTLARLRPYMFAMTFGYAAGLLSLSRCYTVPTQLMLALATTYLVLAARRGSAVIPRLDWACARRITGVGLFFLVATYAFVRIMIQRGSH